MTDEAPPAPPLVPRRRAAEDLRRTAGIVMVLSAMGEIRGGRDPAAVERVLAAEARERLAIVCEAVKPKDLFSRESVMALVDDLGLRSKDHPVGLRPTRMSISEKLLLGKRKMEESKVFSSAPVHPSQFHPPGFVTNPEMHSAVFHGNPRFLPDKPRPISQITGGFHAPVVYTPPISSAASSIKHSHVNDPRPSSSLVKPYITPLDRDSSKLSNTDNGYFRFEMRPNGIAYSSQIRDRIPTNVHHSSMASGQLNQSHKVGDHNPLNAEGINEIKSATSNSQETKEKDVNASAPQATPVNLLIGHHVPHGLTYVHPPPTTSHSDIAKKVQRLLQSKAIQYPSGPLPSTVFPANPGSCQICKIAFIDVDTSLICDNCEGGYHFKCLPPYIKKENIHKLEWHCVKCLNDNDGKPLPSKYGWVTKAKVLSKSIVSHPPSERQAESAVSKAKDTKKCTPNGNPGLSSTTSASGFGTDHNELTPDGTTMNATENQVSNSPTNVMRKVEAEVLDTETESLKTETKVNMLSQCNEGTSTSENTFCSKIIEENITPSLTPVSVVGITCQMQVPDIKFESKTNMPVIHECASNEPPEISTYNNNGNPCREKENSVIEEISSRISDELEASEPTHNVVTQCADEDGLSGRPLPLELHTLEWIGGILQVIEDNSYYNACCINGTLYELQDHVLLNQNATPAKIHSLWEDSKTGSKWAIVIPYYFPSELPEFVSKPCIPESSEVYASTIKKTIMAGLIHDHCEVFLYKSEEGGNRSLSGDEKITSKIFFKCRWTYNESKRIFQPAIP